MIVGDRFAHPKKNMCALKVCPSSVQARLCTEFEVFEVRVEKLSVNKRPIIRH